MSHQFYVLQVCFCPDCMHLVYWDKFALEGVECWNLLPPKAQTQAAGGRKPRWVSWIVWSQSFNDKGLRLEMAWENMEKTS